MNLRDLGLVGRSYRCFSRCIFAIKLPNPAALLAFKDWGKSSIWSFHACFPRFKANSHMDLLTWDAWKDHVESKA